MAKRKSNPRSSKTTRKSVTRRAGGTRGVSSTRRGSGTKRTRPSVRSTSRKSKVNRNPLPKAPPRRTLPKAPSIRSQSSGGTRSAPKQSGTRSMPRSQSMPQQDNLMMEVSQLRSQFSRLEGAAQLPDIYDAIGEIDKQLIQLPVALETLRNRGYVHSGQIEDELEAIDDQWDDIRPRIDTALKNHVRRLDSEMDQVERRINSLGNRLNASAVRNVDMAVDSLDNEVQSARTAVSGLYSGVDQTLDKIAWQIRRHNSMLDILDDSQAIRMREAEGPLLVVNAEWEIDGEDGPDGILVLTDQRMLFEQREEVVTKKRFGLFKAESEMVQELKLEISIHDIDEVDHSKEGGFLGMGKDDILNLICSAAAPVSRARFHLDGQRSEDWASMIKRVQTGDIDKDRADEYLDEIDEAEETAAAFPELCPTCFAPVPPQPRGITTYECEFCGLIIEPKVEEEAAEEDE